MSISNYLVCLIAAVVLLSFALPVAAFETDQYDLPPVPLADIGDEVSEYTEQNLIAAVHAINREIDLAEQCLLVRQNNARDCKTPADAQLQLSYLRSDAAVAKAVYERLGEGSLFITKTGKWFNSHQFRGGPDRYKTSYASSPYIFMPINYATLSPTIRAFGSEFGSDKVEHFFQQGYKYHSIYQEERKKGRTEEQAEQAAVRWGKHTENTYFGLLVSGVYSNADLYANFAGMKFYEGLTRSITVGGKDRPAILVLRDGRWAVNPQIELRQTLIRPFIDDHLNEAWNPSIYSFNVYPTVKRVVTNQACPVWRKLYPGFTAGQAASISSDLESWRGEDYGWKKGDRMVPIALCFEQAIRSTP
jgi:hypothetical protein